MHRSRALSLLLLLAARPGLAQHPDREPATLSLAEALAVAYENNPAYRIALSDLEIASTLERGLWSAYLPTLSLSFGTGINQSRNYTGIDEFGRPVRRDDPVVYTSSRSNQGLAIGQITLFDGGQKIAAARGNRARAEGLRAGVELASIELRSRLARRYYDAVAAEREIALHERAVESAREALTGTERLLRVGLKDPLDLLGAELQLAEREHGLERARGAARLARLALGTEMGIGREVASELVDELPAAFDPASLDVGRLVGAATEASPGISRLEAGVAAAEHQLSAARGRRWPSVSLGASSGRSLSRSGSDALFDLNPLDQSYGVSLSLNLPVFDQFQTSNATAQARAARISAEENLRGGRLQLETRLRAALIDLENAYRDIGLAERSAELSRQRLQLAQQKYQLGGTSFESLRTAGDEAFTREHAVLTATHAFASALLALEEAAGVALR